MPMSRLRQFLHCAIASLVTQLVLGALLVATIDATLLWDVVYHMPPDYGLDAPGVMLTLVWFMIAA